ncbi:MAG TPA: 16S rRNA (cytosine(967)-C(5))-methyltransferase RsmB [Syntrophobacteria bacterium]|nr:16S rRNA (cytosine(967)-C(5))-methyltransferase RsmB [Syntrophobacteria bacterium]
MTTPRAMAMHILMQVARRAAFPDVLLDVYFKKNPALDTRDRAFATELVYGVLRWQGRLDWIIDRYARVVPKRMALPVRVLLRLAAYQLLFLDRVPPAAAVHEAVELAKASQPQHVVRFVNGVLRAIGREREILKSATAEGIPAEQLAVRHSYPVWLVQRWLRELGSEETDALCHAGNQVAPTTIRTNTLKTTPEALATALRESGFSVEPGRLTPEALHLRAVRTDLSSLPEYARGEFQVQDEASQLVAWLLDPRPGDRVLDACAGMGVKTTHLAQLMGNRGEIVAVDSQGWKLTRLAENARRLQVSCLQTVEGDLLALEKGDRLAGSFDRVLVDAPCTGLGVLRRNPDIKWKVGPKDCRRLHLLQTELLSRAAELVRPGGVLVYATCTLTPEENEGTVNAFLNGRGDFSPEDGRAILPPSSRDVVEERGSLKTWPHRHGVDGFFAARLRRSGQESDRQAG